VIPTKVRFEPISSERKKQGKKVFFESKVGYSETLQVCGRRRFCKTNEFIERPTPQTPGSRKILNRFGLKSLISYCIQFSPQQIKKETNIGMK